MLGLIITITACVMYGPIVGLLILIALILLGF